MFPVDAIGNPAGNLSLLFFNGMRYETQDSFPTDSVLVIPPHERRKYAIRPTCHEKKRPLPLFIDHLPDGADHDLGLCGRHPFFLRIIRFTAGE
jgi:hypothetical protein